MAGNIIEKREGKIKFDVEKIIEDLLRKHIDEEETLKLAMELLRRLRISGAQEVRRYIRNLVNEIVRG